MQKIRDTTKLKLTIEPDNNLKCWANSSYAVHQDMKSHTGIFVTIGKGASYLTSCKPQLNTKSSTEAELVAVYDKMGQILWTKHFLAAQGVHISMATIYQDNKSTILLAENGWTSSSNRTRPLNVRDFFITDKLKNGEVKVSFCFTTNMLADFFTKQLCITKV